MNFSYTEEQEMLRDTLQRFIARDYGFDKRQALLKSDAGFSRDHWRTFAELGLLGISFPEDYEGMGGNAIDTMLVMEAIGQGLILEPYLATVVLCGGLIRDAGSNAQKQLLLPAIARGELMMALAHYDQGTRYETGRVATTARQDGDEYVLDGRKSVVLHGAQADRLIVSARTGGAAHDPDGVSLFIVDPEASGVAVHEYRTHDGQRAAEIVLHGVSVGHDALIGEEGRALPVIERALGFGIAALCAEAVGAMHALHQATLEYAKTRKQFGVTIGSFQVLKHRMADMFIATEQARSMAILAAMRAHDEDALVRRRAIAAAKALTGQTARYVGQQAVQLHGGMGVTDELNVSHYFKRLTMINATFGDADYHLGQFSDLMLAA